MNNDDKALLATLSICLIAGGSYFGYSYLFGPKDIESFANLLGESVLTLTGSTNKTEWESRLSELKARKNKLSGALVSIADQSWNNLQSWCKENSNNNLKKDTNYRGFEEFCTWKIGDKEWEGKIAATVDASGKQWEEAYKVLKKGRKRKLSPNLQAIYEKKTKQNLDKKDMYDWCISSYKRTWRGEDSRDFTEVQEFCKSNSK